MAKALVIGGGMGGCCAAHFLSKVGVSVDLVERAPFLGGGVKTFFHGGHPYTVGPRHFLTTKERNFEFLNQYVPMRRIQEHEFLTYIERDASFYNFPIHREDIERMPDREQILTELGGLEGAGAARDLEEYWLASVGPTLYSKFVETYTKKMWQIESNTEMDTFDWSPKGVALKSGPKAAWTEAISAFPLKINGYDDYFEIATRGAQVHLNTTIEGFDIENYRVKIEGNWHTYDVIVSSISPEILLNDAYGPLRWIGRDFFKIVLPLEEVFPPNVYFLYYANDEPFTRIVEYKKFYKYQSPTTLLGLEIPSFKNKLYPYPTLTDQAAAQKYHDALPEKVFSVGRAAVYKYIDMTDIIDQSFDMEEALS